MPPQYKLCSNLFSLGKIHSWVLGFFFILGWVFLSNNSLCKMAAVSAFILKLLDISFDCSHLSDKCYCDCVLYPCSGWFLMIMLCLPHCFTLNYRCHYDRTNYIQVLNSTPFVWCQCLHYFVPRIKIRIGRYAKHFCLKIMFCQLLNKWYFI